MSGEPMASPGRIWIGPRELLTILGLVFVAGGGWTALQAQGREVDRLKSSTGKDHDVVTGLERDVKQVASDIEEIKDEQREHRKLLLNIWQSVSRVAP